MAHRKQMLFAGVAALACMTWSPAAVAEPDEEELAPPKAVPVAPSPFGIKAVPPQALAARRGGTEVFNDMKLKGVVADNYAGQLVTGSNIIADGALSGTAGVPVVIQNSGNNVLIQSATIVNVQVK